jgi:hypothetical protein
MIHLQRTGDNETVPGIKCDSCGALTMFDTTLRDDQLNLTADDHEEMRAAVEERFGWRRIINVTQIGPSEMDLCSRCAASKLVPIPHS